MPWTDKKKRNGVKFRSMRKLRIIRTAMEQYQARTPRDVEAAEQIRELLSNYFGERRNEILEEIDGAENVA